MPFQELIPFFAVAAIVAGLVAVVLARRRPRAAQRLVLIDGSNVMYWQANMPRLEPVAAVVTLLVARGETPGVVFDANAGWKLEGRFLNDAAFAQRLGLPVAQVMVVPKGTQADPFLLAAARDKGAPIVTNDRYRDWATSFPEITRQGFLLRGGWRDGAVWVQEAVG